MLETPGPGARAGEIKVKASLSRFHVQRLKAAYAGTQDHTGSDLIQVAYQMALYWLTSFFYLIIYL